MKAHFFLAALVINSFVPITSAATTGPAPIATFDQKPVIVCTADGTLLASVAADVSGSLARTNHSR